MYLKHLVKHFGFCFSVSKMSYIIKGPIQLHSIAEGSIGLIKNCYTKQKAHCCPFRKKYGSCNKSLVRSLGFPLNWALVETIFVPFEKLMWYIVSPASPGSLLTLLLSPLCLQQWPLTTVFVFVDHLRGAPVQPHQGQEASTGRARQ